MVAKTRVIRHGHAAHICNGCGKTDDVPGDWYWTNVDCTLCSECYVPFKRVLKGVTYLRIPSDTEPSDRRYYQQKSERERQSRMATLMVELQKVLKTPRTIPYLAATLGVKKETIRDRLNTHSDLFVCVQQSYGNKIPAKWQLRSAVQDTVSICHSVNDDLNTRID